MQQIDTGGRRAKRLTGGCLDGRGYAATHDVEQADVATFCALDDDVTPLCEEGYFGDREGVNAYERIVEDGCEGGIMRYNDCTILPFVRSYGLISTLTLSPGRMRM